MPASAAVKGVARPERASPPAAAPASPVCTAGGTAPLCGRVPRVARVPWHGCTSAAVRRSSRASARIGGAQNDEPRPRRYPPLGLVNANYHLLLATYCRHPLLTGKGLDNTNYRAAVAGAVSGAYHVRAMAEQYGVPVREQASRRWEVGGGGWW